MIIHKGERFIPAEYRDEVELENVVYANLANMFGDKAIKVPFKTKLRTDDDVETIPDAIVLDFKKNKWYIVEVELVAHSTYGHILPQVTKQKIAVSTLRGKERLIEAVFAKILRSPRIRQQLREQGIEEIEIKDKLEQLIKRNDPIFAIPIDQINNDQLTWKNDQKYKVDFWQIKKYLPIDYEIRPLYLFPEKTKPSFVFTSESKAKRLKTITHRNGPLFDLISAGVLFPAEVLFMPRKTKKAKTRNDHCELTADGGIELEGTDYGEVTADGWIKLEGHKLSPTLAAEWWDAIEGVRGKAVDGWERWVDYEGRTLQTLGDECLGKACKVKRAKSPSPSK
jgi:hypothetical protein